MAWVAQREFCESDPFAMACHVIRVICVGGANTFNIIRCGMVVRLLGREKGECDVDMHNNTFSVVKGDLYLAASLPVSQ